MKNRIPILLIVDHASNFIPKKYNNLGLNQIDIDTHIAFDLYIRKTSLKLARKIGARVICGKYSRLLIDLNRGINDPTLINCISDKKIIPGNIAISSKEKKLRLNKIYSEYHLSIAKTIMSKKIKMIISMHSFNPIFKNKKREFDIGILSNNDRRYSDILISNLNNSSLSIGNNEPYKGNLIGDTLSKHALKNKLFHTLIEIRNDIISSNKKINNIVDILSYNIFKSNKELFRFL